MRQTQILLRLDSEYASKRSKNAQRQMEINQEASQ